MAHFGARPTSCLRPEVPVFHCSPGYLSRMSSTRWTSCADLASGVWQDRYAGLVEQQELDLGYYLIIVELA
jgi:hypothetical protein